MAGAGRRVRRPAATGGKPLHFAPKLPPGISRLAFRLFFRGRLLEVETTGGEARYTLLEGEPMDLAHYGTPFALSVDEPVTHALPAVPDLAAPKQPPGRAPQPLRAFYLLEWL